MEKNQPENKFAKRVTQRELSTHVAIQTAKHPGGRPKKNDETKQSEKVFLTLTKAEKEKIDQYADRTGESIAGAIRRALKEMGMI
ncbi:MULTISPECIES: hypothetical protein [unclassified Sulfuricurvum]|jgi:predicted lactoylglutathione lyase|uniref:hypothetical protein n=1 Tax=unclassified Sulfuricurvum TaxID=2632390 RepID=UPI0005062BA8|nr:MULTISPECIES: hypothetical protein [unclassified Sulfuricurvum]KFN40363.1 MAG: hypothetical protein JU82_03575 [Sulfuricurvum sp. MLSB]